MYGKMVRDGRETFISKILGENLSSSFLPQQEKLQDDLLRKSRTTKQHSRQYLQGSIFRQTQRRTLSDIQQTYKPSLPLRKMLGLLLNILAICGVLLAAPTYSSNTTSMTNTTRVANTASAASRFSLGNITWHYPVLLATNLSTSPTLSSISVSATSVSATSSSYISTTNTLTPNTSALTTSTSTASIPTASILTIPSSTTLPSVQIEWSSLPPTPTASATTVPSLSCGAHQPVPTELAYTNGPGFSLCMGNWTALDFCSVGAGDQPLWHGQLRPQRQYYPLSTEHGIYVSLEVQTNRLLRNNDKPPKDQKNCGEVCNSECFTALTSIINDCK